MSILPARAYAKNLLDFISKASKRRIEWRGDWYRKVDGKTVVTPMDDHVGDLIEQYVQARIEAENQVPEDKRCAYPACGWPEDAWIPHGPCDASPGHYCKTDRCHPFAARAAITKATEE